jgi:acyl-CoA reductase-like NAD-dependent aldehyde dehydrogenase
MNPSSINSKPQFSRLLAAHIDGRATSVRYRQQQLQRLHRALASNKETLVHALVLDNGITKTEAYFEYAYALSELSEVYESINFGAELLASRSLEVPRFGIHRKRGMGLVYIKTDRTMSSIYSVTSPLGAALAAGNCIIVEVSRESVALLQQYRSLTIADASIYQIARLDLARDHERSLRPRYFRYRRSLT